MATVNPVGTPPERTPPPRSPRARPPAAPDFGATSSPWNNKLTCGGILALLVMFVVMYVGMVRAAAVPPRAPPVPAVRLLARPL